MIGNREYLAVPYAERFAAAAAGARWDVAARQWYANEGSDMAKMDRWRGDRSSPRLSEDAAKREFLDLASSLGVNIDPTRFKTDGTWQHVAVENDGKGQKAGSYKFQIEDNGRAHGYVKNLKTDEGRGYSSDTGRVADVVHRRLTAEQVAQRRAAEELDQERGYERVAARARALLNSLPEATSHLYATQKGFPDLRTESLKSSQDGRDLFVPLVAVERPERPVMSYQKIMPVSDTGAFSKLFATGARKKGCAAVIGREVIGERVAVAEGWATGSSVHRGSGAATFAAMDAGNIPAVVAALMRTGHEAKNILVCPDDDEVTPAKVADRLNNSGAMKNLGLEPVAAGDVDLAAGSLTIRTNDGRQKDMVASLQVERDGSGHVLSVRAEVAGNGQQHAVTVKNAGRVAGEECRRLGTDVLYPPLTPEDRRRGLTDFNDLQQQRGVDAVRAMFKGKGRDLALEPDMRFARPAVRERSRGGR